MQSAPQNPKAVGRAILPHESQTEQQERRERLRQRVLQQMKAIHASIFPAQPSSIAPPGHDVQEAVAWALDRPVREITCLSVPMSNPDLAKLPGIPLSAIGERVIANFLNEIHAAGERRFREAWAQIEAQERSELETRVRGNILEHFCNPLWNKLERSLNGPCWEIEDPLERSMHSYVRENVIGIPLLYVMAGAAGAEELCGRLQPIIANFPRFIPFVQISVQHPSATSAPQTTQDIWLGLDMLA